MLTLEQIDEKLLQCREEVERLHAERESLKREYKRKDGDITDRIVMINKKRSKLTNERRYGMYTKESL